MKVKTTTAQFNVSPDILFDFVSKIENLPLWATSYCKGLKQDGEDYIVLSPEGDMYQVMEADSSTGIIDMKAGPTKEQLWCWPARVTTDNQGGSVLAFTAIQMPGQPEEQFAQQCSELVNEFNNIRRLVEVEATA